ncbi:hypothetical protein ACQEVC_36810 [Plantactinospora sp. CA-294935]|uniref:hypothetical protein n=1 Tax=Plantactinospora sp. CA-294935 TaxID=3240012 RepID=UPI003D8D7C2A
MSDEWFSRLGPPDATGANAAGDLWIAPSLIALVEPDVAWLGLRELHHAAIGTEGFRYVTDAGKLWPDDAFTAYSNGLSAVLGQIGVTSPAVGNHLLGSICDTVDLYGGFDGLESAAAAAFQSASRLGGVTAEMDQFQWLASSRGAPSHSGGGAQHSTIFDVASRTLGQTPIGQVAHVFSHVTSSQEMSRDLAGLARDVGGGPDVQHAAGKVGEVIGSTAAGAAGGALLGSAIPGVGTLAGGIIGAVAGFFQGLFGGSGDHHSREHASGDKVPVHSDVRLETRDGKPYVAHPHGHVGPSHHAPASGHRPHHGLGHKTIEPHPHKCEVEGRFDEAFAVPFWAAEAQLVGGMVPIGPGRQGLFQRSPTGSLLMGELAEIDELGTLHDPGAVFQELLVAPEWRLTADGVERWVERVPRTRLTTLRDYQRLTVEALRHVRVSPETSVRDAVAVLRQYTYGM